MMRRILLPAFVLAATVASTAAFTATTRYEAEAPGNTLVGCMARKDGNWWSGTGFVGDLGESKSDMLMFNNVMADVAGQFDLLVFYKTWGTRPMDLVVNDGPAVRISCPEGPNNLGSVTQQISLKAGSNTVALWATGSWAPDVDYIEVSGGPAVPEPSSLAALAGLLAPAGVLLRKKRA